MFTKLIGHIIIKKGVPLKLNEKLKNPCFWLADLKFDFCWTVTFDFCLPLLFSKASWKSDWLSSFRTDDGFGSDSNLEFLLMKKEFEEKIEKLFWVALMKDVLRDFHRSNSNSGHLLHVQIDLLFSECLSCPSSFTRLSGFHSELFESFFFDVTLSFFAVSFRSSLCWLRPWTRDGQATGSILRTGHHNYAGNIGTFVAVSRVHTVVIDFGRLMLVIPSSQIPPGKSHRLVFVRNFEKVVTWVSMWAWEPLSLLDGWIIHPLCHIKEFENASWSSRVLISRARRPNGCTACCRTPILPVSNR